MSRLPRPPSLRLRRLPRPAHLQSPLDATAGEIAALQSERARIERALAAWRANTQALELRHAATLAALDEARARFEALHEARVAAFGAAR